VITGGLWTGIKEGMWKPVHVNMKQSREETEMALYACIKHILKNTGIRPDQVGTTVQYCSGTEIISMSE
jgi:hypothetical protein